MTRPQEARKTALVVGCMLLAFMAWSLWRHHPVRGAVLGSLGSALVLLGLVAPRWTVPFHIVWMKFAGALGYVNSRVILGFLYYGVFTPVGWAMKLAGHDPLNRRRPNAESYWVPRATPRQSREQFERLF